MKVLLMPNFHKPNSVSCTTQAIKKLALLGAVPMLDQNSGNQITTRKELVLGALDELLEQCDVILSIGGDGTMLESVKHAVLVNKPVLGINTGRVGFLTQFDGYEMDSLNLLMEGGYSIEERMLLELLIQSPDGPRSFYAVNDIVITRDAYHMTELDIYNGDRHLVRYRGDGVIFATPTGSTAYSMSAGGSVVDPSLSVILMTAICPFTPYNRSLVLPPDGIYTVRLEGMTQVEILADNMQAGKIIPGQFVTVKKADAKAKFINLGLRDFYRSLREKLI